MEEDESRVDHEPLENDDLSKEAWSVFCVLVDGVLRRWPILRAVVDSSLGCETLDEAKEKENDLIHNVLYWHASGDVFPDELKGLFDSFLDEEFSTRVEDSSTADMAKVICDFYKDCKDERLDRAREAISKLAPVRDMKGAVYEMERMSLGGSEEHDDDDKDEDTDMKEVYGGEEEEEREEDDKKKEPEVDEDGFQVVTKRSRRKRK
eukprot:TRINITY_DN81680_c0_g1_i1.p1 TRINITY_DN81680_c0_g1~~TRINITY_DN81680_c0_g1_i1.p1  ORF type:complete len:207 (+),score=82.09 TRINITY_DN81680_c0_g1_i1:88-708(+)